MQSFAQFIDEAFASNAAHALGLRYMGFGYWGDGKHATHRSVKNTLTKMDAPTPMPSQPAGSMVQLPQAWKAHLTKNELVGDNSNWLPTHEEGAMTSFSKFKNHVRDSMVGTALKGNAALVVKVNGKHAGMITRTGGYSARPEYNAFGGDSKVERERSSGGGWQPPRRKGEVGHVKPTYHYKDASLGKEEAFDTLHSSLAPYMLDDETLQSKSFWKNNKVEVLSLAHDKARGTVKAERSNKPQEQENKKLGQSRVASRYDANPTVSTSPEGSMKDIRTAAATKFVDKKMGSSSTFDHDSHLAKIKDLMVSGAKERDVRDAFDAMMAAHSNVKADDSTKQRLVKNLANPGYDRAYALDGMKRT